ncbi:MAG: L-threonylcarbamoyladenylate synthase [Thermodesulfobacteriota bacterium]
MNTNASSFDVFQAAQAVRMGKIIIYPTETFWALGGSACLNQVVSRVSDMKKRPSGKPLPVIIGCENDLNKFFYPSPEELEIASFFWPGPLSIVVKAGPRLASGLNDSRGRVCVRWSAHAQACELAAESGCPLISTSANVSGFDPAREFSELHKDIVKKADFCLQTRDTPRGGLPSTVIEVTGKMACRILRPGKVSRDDLQAKRVECLL